jgi:hypothetical protein
MAAPKITTKQIVLGLGVLYFLPSIIDIFRKGQVRQNEQIIKQEKEKNSKVIDKTYTDKSGKVVGKKRETIDLSVIAALIYDAFYNNDWTGFTEDETKAIAAIKNVPKTLIPQLAAIYKTKYKKNLVDDFIRFLDNDQYKAVQALFR